MGQIEGWEALKRRDDAEVKDTRKDDVMGGGEGLKVIQVAKNGSNNFLKTEKKRHKHEKRI